MTQQQEQSTAAGGATIHTSWRDVHDALDEAFPGGWRGRWIVSDAIRELARQRDEARA